MRYPCLGYPEGVTKSSELSERKVCSKEYYNGWSTPRYIMVIIVLPLVIINSGLAARKSSLWCPIPVVWHG